MNIGVIIPTPSSRNSTLRRELARRKSRYLSFRADSIHLQGMCASVPTEPVLRRNAGNGESVRQAIHLPQSYRLTRKLSPYYNIFHRDTDGCIASNGYLLESE